MVDTGQREAEYDGFKRNSKQTKSIVSSMQEKLVCLRSSAYVHEMICRAHLFPRGLIIDTV